MSAPGEGTRNKLAGTALIVLISTGGALLLSRWLDGCASDSDAATVPSTPQAPSTGNADVRFVVLPGPAPASSDERRVEEDPQLVADRQMLEEDPAEYRQQERERNIFGPFAAEDRSEWAPRMESNIDVHLRDFQIEFPEIQLDIRERECRSSMCRLELVYPSMRDYSEAERHIITDLKLLHFDGCRVRSLGVEPNEQTGELEQLMFLRCAS